MNTLKNLTGYVRPLQCPTDSASAGSSIFHTVLMVRTHYTTNHFTTLISQLSDLRSNAHFHKVCPAPYQQLFTICFIYHDGNEGYADYMDSRLIPRLYCRLSGKSQLIYETLVQLIIEKAAHWNFDISWQKSVSNFEQSIFNALTAKFPDLIKRGCHFHFCQALFRRIQRNMKVSHHLPLFLHLTKM
jgi:hypothetical protein